VQNRKLLYANRKLYNILRLESEDLDLKELIELLSETDDQDAIKHIGNLSKGEILSPITYKLTDRSGEKNIVQFSVETLKLDNRKLLIGRLIDTMNESSVENDLFSSLTVLNAIFNSIEDGICVLDSKDYSIISSNKAAEWIFGTTSGELIGRKVSELALYSQKFEKKLLELQKNLPYSGTVHFENVMRSSGNIHFPALLRLNEIVNDLTNETDTLLLVITDITHRVHLDRTLTEVESRYHLLFDKSSDAIFVTDLKSEKIVEANRAAELLTGYSREALIDLPYGSLIPPLYILEETERRKQIHKAGSLIYEGKILMKNGVELPVQMNMTRTKLSGRNVLISSCRDISQQVELEQERMQIAKLDAVREMAGGIAHEASQPLQSLMSISDILNYGDTKPKKVEELISHIPYLVKRIHMLLEQMKSIVRVEKMTYTQESDIIDIGKSTGKKGEK